MQVDYEVTVKTPTGAFVDSLNDFIELEYARAFRTVGSLRIVLPDDYDIARFGVDHQIHVYRAVEDRPPSLDMDTIWQIDRVSYSIEDAQWTVHASDLLSVLARRRVAYTRETPYADKTQEELGNDNHLPADDCIKAYVRENFSSEVLDAVREIPARFFEVQPDKGVAPKIEKEASFQVVLDVLRDICNMSEERGMALYFDLFPMSPERFQFRTFTDHYRTNRASTSHQPLVLAARSNLSNAEITWDYSQLVSNVYVGGLGDGSDRIIVQAENVNISRRSPWSRREVFVDERDADAMGYLADAAAGALAAGKPRVIIEGQINEVAGSRYGIDYFYGDSLVVSEPPYAFDCLVNAVRVTVKDGRERIEARLRGEMVLEPFVTALPPTPPEVPEEIWLQGFVEPSDVLVAYEPYNAVDLAGSYVNLANPGTWDAGPQGGGPTLLDGWVFPGTSAPDPEVYLSAVVSGHLARSMILAYRIDPSDAFQDSVAAGVSGGTVDTNFWLAPTAASHTQYANGGIETQVGTFQSGVMAVAGLYGYRNGEIVTSPLLARADDILSSVLIGGLNAPGFEKPFKGTISHFYLFSVDLTPAQVAAISAAIQADLA